MQNEERSEGGIVIPVVGYKIVEDEGKEQEEHPEETQKKSAGQSASPGKAVNVAVMVEYFVEEDPAGGHQGEAIPEMMVAGDIRKALCPFGLGAVYEEERPGRQCGTKIGQLVDQRMSASFNSGIFGQVKGLYRLRSGQV